MSKIKIYKTDIIPSKNALIEDLDTYLLQCPVTYTNDDFQYQKIDLDIVIKIVATQDSVYEELGNYVEIEQDYKKHYFFVMSSTWLAKSCVQLELSYDSINSIKLGTDYTFSDRTNVIRQHSDTYKIDNQSQFVPNTTIHLHKKIDKVSEGFSGVTTNRISQTAVNQESAYGSQKWYLVYENETNQVNTPIRVSLYPKVKTPYESASSRYVRWDWEDITTSKTYVIYKGKQPNLEFRLAGNTFTFSSSVYAVGIERHPYHSTSEDYEWIEVFTYNNLYQKSSTFIFRGDGLDGDYIEFVNAEDCYIVDTTSATQVDPLAIIGFWPTKDINASVHNKRYLESVDTIDRSLSTIIQIVELPYLPDDSFVWTGENLSYDTNVWTLTDYGVLRLKNYTAEFENTVRTIGLDTILTDTFVTTSETNFKNLTRDFVENTLGVKDSKFLNSELTTYKLGYDTESIELKLERLDYDYNSYSGMPNYEVKFKPSNTLSNQFGFKCDLKKCKYNSDSDFYNYMVSAKDTKLTLYNSEWLNYVRNGRTQDLWANSISSVATAGSSVVNVLSSLKIASVAKASKAGLSSIASASTVAGIAVTVANGVASTVNSWLQQNAKEKQIKAQASTINGNSSIDLFDWYGGNKLYVYQYTVPNDIKEKVADMFYYCGYAVDKQQIPNTNSRVWFNYVQCNAVFDQLPEVYNNFRDDLIARWSNGVTIYHKVGNNSYDLSQTKANWQTSLF